MASPHAQRARTKSDTGDELRIRAAWIYYIEGETQSNVAAILGVNRITVTRLLSEARRRGEVSIQIKGEMASLTELQRDLKNALVWSGRLSHLCPMQKPTRQRRLRPPLGRIFRR